MELGQDAEQWINVLRQHVETKPIVLLRLSDNDLTSLLSSRNGVSEFTMAKRHSALSGTRTPCVVLIFGGRTTTSWSSRPSTQKVAYVGILQSKHPFTTLETRIKVKRSVLVEPTTERKLINLLDRSRFAHDLSERLLTSDDLITLSPKLSVAVVDALLKIDANLVALQSVTAGFRRPRTGSMEALQLDAVETALKAFGLPVDSAASNLFLARRAESSLARTRVYEDGVIEHDARTVPGYQIIDSDVTGRAIFQNGKETLEVYTANRRKLEEVFGVDLIYVNRFHGNVIMLQYKMLEPSDDEASEWVYREDAHLHKQLRTMERFAAPTQSSVDYRLNSTAFYFKFIRRLGPSSRTNVLLPLCHLRQMLNDKNCRTKSGKVKVTFSALKGSYLRQSAFFSLLQCGYIGSHSSTTRDLRVLIEDVVTRGNTLVFALQREALESELEAARARSLSSYENRWSEED